jgi:hypothetical protein
MFQTLHFYVGNWETKESRTECSKHSPYLKYAPKTSSFASSLPKRKDKP